MNLGHIIAFALPTLLLYFSFRRYVVFDHVTISGIVGTFGIGVLLLFAHPDYKVTVSYLSAISFGIAVGLFFACSSKARYILKQ